MLNWWNTLTQDNKVKLTIPLVIAVLAGVGYFWRGKFESTKPLSNDTQVLITQTTTGSNSPAVSNTQGDVTFNMNSPTSED